MLLRDLCAVIPNNYQKCDNWPCFNYLDTGNLLRNQILEIQMFKNECLLPSRAKQKVQKGQILYSSVRPNQEHYGFIEKDYPYMLASTGFIILTPNAKLVNPKFLYYFLTQNAVINQMQSVAQNSTSAYPSISKDDLLGLEIDLPDRKTQDTIVEILSGIDEQINRNNEVVKRLQVLIHTKYSSLYSDKMEPNGMIKDVCTLPSGYSFKPETYCENGDYKLITIKNVNDIFVDTAKTDRLSVLPKQMKDYCELRIGDILMSLTGNVGRLSIVSEERNLLNQRVSLLNCKEKYKTYVYALLSSQKYQITMQKISRGTSQKNLSPLDVECLPLYIPQNINSFYNETIQYFNQMINVHQSTQRLIELKRVVLPLFINGQLSS